MSNAVPSEIPNWIGGAWAPARSREWLDKPDPRTGRRLCQLARSGAADVTAAVAAARDAQPGWAQCSPIDRGRVLLDVALALRSARERLAAIVSAETGKAPREALAETDAAVAQGLFMAGEGARLFGRTLPSGDADRQVLTVRAPVGVAALVVAANTPIANVAWKVFPALVCGNAAVLKAAEDAPATAKAFAEIAHDAGLPAGVLNVVQGLGPEAGAALIDADDIDLISFTGSSQVGRDIAARAGARLLKVSLELGGKNALVVCDDADIEGALHWSLASSFSNAGQRCSASSRLVVFDGIYAAFRDALAEHARALRVGPGDDDFMGPVINARHLERLLAAVGAAEGAGARVLTGGRRLTDESHAAGFYMSPTLLESAPADAPISRTELFGPVACLYRVADLEQAIALVNDGPYGLTAAIHTRSVHRALEFARRVQAGVVSVNRGTHGSEPHMPFGGPKASGNGWREPGTEALDVYSELKNVHLGFDPRLA